jgi:hypothetical protein
MHQQQPSYGFTDFARKPLMPQRNCPLTQPDLTDL